MESKFGGMARQFYGPVVSDLKAVGKRSMEWDLNDWKWDGDLFTATPLSPLPSDCRSRQFLPVRPEIQSSNGVGLSNGVTSGLDAMTFGNENGRRELEKRRRGVVGDDKVLDDEAGSLNLKLGGQVYPITEGEMEKWEGKSGKKSKVVGFSASRAVCQVDDCQVDLSNAKDYHRRHKVCDMHSKATRALVGNVMQRFCQQCSRFHVLPEFDEGKRSCRRRLAGHNRRRRKTHPEKVSEASLNEEQGTNYLLISLLRILANIHSNSSDQTNNQDLLSHLLKNLANLTGNVNERSLTGLLNGSQNLQNAGTSNGTLSKVAPMPAGNCVTMPALDLSQGKTYADNHQYLLTKNPSNVQPSFVSQINGSNSAETRAEDTPVGRSKLNNIDLNNAYDDTEEFTENQSISVSPANVGNISPGPSWGYRETQNVSPPQTSGNTASTSSLSPSNSSGEAQSRTDRIVFKLFGKDPSDFPLILRKQILDWLSNSPTDIESYIRPGCIMLTIYLRMDESAWEELCRNLSSSLKRLLNVSADSFWRTGWVYTRVRNHVAFMYNGDVVLDATLPFTRGKTCMISSIKPIAVSSSEKVQFFVNGFSLYQSTTRLLCALEGSFLVKENCANMDGHADALAEHNEIQSLSFPCIIPNVSGRGFIEVEDHGLSSSFFPFIVAEKEICSEIRTLESIIEASETANGISIVESRNRALDFVHEMGWLLHRSHLKNRLGQAGPYSVSFPLKRFRWLMEFSVDHDWIAVVKKLLGILFNGIVDIGPHTSIQHALLEIGLLHRAVGRNCRSMVEFLLRYRLDRSQDNAVSEHTLHVDKAHHLFRSDAPGPHGLTPLHIVACQAGFDDVLDALTDDPESVGIEAWSCAIDSSGVTPNDYASLRGHFSYIDLVQRKINQKSCGHVTLDIPGTLLDSSTKHKLMHEQKPLKVASLQVAKAVTRPDHRQCRQCEQKLYYGSTRRSLAIHRPAMLSMVAIAAICVCVALLFKSSPEVLYVFRPFRWESLKYGAM